MKMTDLGTVAEILMGQSPDSTSYNNDEIGVPFLQGCAEFGQYYPDPEVYCHPPLRISKTDSILISVRAPVGKTNWSDQNYCIGRGLGSVKAKNGLSDTRFLKYVLEYNTDFLHKRSQGSTFLAIGSNDLKLFPIPDISLARQQKIASILETIDKAIAHTEALIQKYQQIKAGLMHDLFTRGITSDGQLRPPREQAPELYRDSAIGWIPKEWKVSLCSDLFSIDSGITLGPHRRPNKNPYPYLRVANVFREKITVDDIFKLEASSEEVSKYRLHQYDMLLVEGHANRQEIGRCAMVFNNAEGMLFQNHLFRLRAINLDNWYALFLLNSHLSRNYWEMKCSTSSGLNTINKRMLSNMQLCVPEREEQTSIAALIRAKNQMLLTEARKLNKLQHLKSGLMQDLLTGKVPVTISES